MCVLAADSDFFPIEGTIDTVERARTRWTALGAPDHLELFRYPTTHRLHPAMADAALDFFHRTLGLPALSRPADTVPVLPEADLRCHSGERRGAIIRDRLLADLPVAGADPDEVTTWLRRAVDHTRVDAQPFVRRLPADDGSTHLLWQSETGIWGCAVANADEPTRLYLTDDGTLAPPVEVRDAIVLDVRGRGALSPRERNGHPTVHHAFSAYRHLSELLWLGDSLAAGQVWDVLWALDHVAASVQEIQGSGYGAYLARLVAVLRPMPLALSDEYVRPDDTSRLWDDGRSGWTGVMPGLAGRWQEVLRRTDPLTVRPNAGR